MYRRCVCPSVDASIWVPAPEFLEIKNKMQCMRFANHRRGRLSLAYSMYTPYTNCPYSLKRWYSFQRKYRFYLFINLNIFEFWIIKCQIPKEKYKNILLSLPKCSHLYFGVQPLPWQLQLRLWWTHRGPTISPFSCLVPIKQKHPLRSLWIWQEFCIFLH